ncbi:MAG: hypothetical protein IT167_20175, partial [Bryobacterales bacterium]|nr:hypothetical protein [Bryobacterales bacterium]
MKRRDFFKQASMAAGAPMMQAAAQLGTKPAIRITDIKTHFLGAGGRNFCFVQVFTDQGIHGVGEAY